MDNFKQFHRQKRPSASLDGMLSGGNRPPSLNRDYHPNRTAETGIGFNVPKTDGFHAAQQPSLNGGDSLISRNLAPFGASKEGAPTARAALTGSHGKRSGRPRLRKALKRGALLFSVILLAGGAYFGVKLYLTSKHLFRGGANAAPALQNNVDAAKLRGEGDGRINVLLIGKGGQNHPGGELTDTLLLASVDPIHKEMALVSIPRDLYVKIPGNGSERINAAYNYGKEQSDNRNADSRQREGIKLLDDTVSAALGVPVHYNAMVDFTAFKEIVNTVGGIDIYLDEPIYDPNFDWQYGRNALKLPKGNVHLNGTQALLLGRSRGAAGGYGVSSDFERNENQRKMLVALKDKILSAGTFGNPVKINQLLNTFGTHVWTDFSSAAELAKLYKIIQTVPANKTQSLDLVTPPNVLITGSTVAGKSVQLPRAGAGNFKEIQAFVRSRLKDGFIRNENASVAVYNATNVAGLAARQAEVLKSYGYNVTKITDAPNKSNNQKTVLVDLTKGVKKYTKRYLEQRFKAATVSKIPDPAIQPGAVDFVIILGQDAASTQ